MKISLLRMWVIWRRFRRGGGSRHEDRLQYSAQAEALMRRADPFSGWDERANWMIDVAEWLRRVPGAASLCDDAWLEMKQQRVRFLLDWLDAHRDTKRVVRATLQKTLREAIGPELFCATGLPREPAFFSELSQRMVKKILPKPPGQRDLSSLFAAMFPQPADADWLLGLDQKTLVRVWKLCADDSISHNYRQQIDEALVYLATMVVSVGIGLDFRQRLEPKMPVQATPFMALRRELDKYLLTPAHDEIALRSVRMLIAVCQAQTDRIYAHLDEHGVSVDLVYRVERMRAQLRRMARLIDLRAAPHGAHGNGQVQALLADLIEAHHQRGSVRGLARRSFSLLARKVVERNADRGEQYAARTRGEYRAMTRAGLIGGVVCSVAVLAMFTLSAVGLARFFEGISASLVYAATFVAISSLGGALAAWQPAVTAPALASKMTALQTAEGMRALLLEIRQILRAQAAAVFGNLLAVVPTMLAVSLAASMLSGVPVASPDHARASLKGLSMLGPAPLYAAATGVLIWLSSLAAGFADNWFALFKLREGLAHNRRLVHALGAMRTERWSRWLERRIAVITGNVSLAIMLGMAPAIAEFFGLPFDVRHVTLSAGTLVVAAGSAGWSLLATPDFWLAVGGVVLTALFNVGVAFGCALTLALRARNVPRRLRRLVFRAVLRRFVTAPRSLLLPDKPGTVVAMPRRDDAVPREEKKRRSGSER